MTPNYRDKQTIMPPISPQRGRPINRVQSNLCLQKNKRRILLKYLLKILLKNLLKNLLESMKPMRITSTASQRRHLRKQESLCSEVKLRTSTWKHLKLIGIRGSSMTITN